MAMTLGMVSMIAPIDAQTVSCSSNPNSKSPQCCWVIRSWQKMGKTTSVNSTDAKACCSGIPGVTCTSAGIVTEINWMSRGLVRSIPAVLGNLRNLQRL